MGARAHLSTRKLGTVEGKPKLIYRGAEVIAAEGACDAARSLTDLRLLSADVPAAAAQGLCRHKKARQMTGLSAAQLTSGLLWLLGRRQGFLH